jgi:hypothetical protein
VQQNAQMKSPFDASSEQGALRVQSIALASTTDLHVSQVRLLETLAAGRPGFVDLHGLPAPLPATQILLASADGTQYAIDASGSKPILRPLVSSSKEASASPVQQSRPTSETSDTAVDAPPPTNPRGHEPGFGEKLLRDSGQALAQQFMTALAGGQSIGAALQGTFGPGGLLTAMGSKSIAGLGDMLMGSMMGQLFGGVNDASSAGAQIAARFGSTLAPQAVAGLGMVSTPEGAAALRTRLAGVGSKASIPLGMGPGGGVRVSVNGEGALIEGDLAMHDTTDDMAPFTSGNAKVLINGKPAVGKKHFAICPKHGAQINPVKCSANVFIGENPASVAKNDANKQVGDSCTPSDEEELKKLNEQLSESEEGGIGRPLECREGAGGSTVQRAEAWDPSDLARDLFGIENNASADQQKQGIDKWSVLWGAIELGSPQEPGAGTKGSWWVPDKVFGYDMSPYYLLHDRIFDDDRSLGDIQRSLGVEATSFGAGVLGRPSAGLLLLQTIYSSVTTGVAVSTSVGNSLGRSRRGPQTNDKENVR